MKDRRKKVFLMSMLSFLVCSSTVYIFFIINAVNDLKSRPYFATQYGGAKRALIPVLKYLGVVDTDVVSDPKKISEIDKEKTDQLLSSSASKNIDSSLSSADDYGANSPGYRVTSSNRPFKAGSKLSSSIGSSVGSSGGSNTSSSLSGGFSNSSRKNIEIDKNASLSDKNKNYQASSLMARLSSTRTLMGNALKAKSGDSARFNWEKGFSGSVSPDSNMMYKNSALALDKMKAEVMDLKIEDSKGLKAPEVGQPQMDRDSVSPDKTKELMQSLTKDLAQSMINAIGNGIGSSPAGVQGEGGSADLENPITRDSDNSRIKNEIEKWKFDPSEKVETVFFTCEMVDCKSMGVSGDGIYKAYFPDGFVLSMDQNAKPVNYYYCVSPNNEQAFLENYNKYILGH
jgi:hypothetical protein